MLIISVAENEDKNIDQNDFE